MPSPTTYQYLCRVFWISSRRTSVYGLRGRTRAEMAKNPMPCVSQLMYPVIFHVAQDSCTRAIFSNPRVCLQDGSSGLVRIYSGRSGAPRHHMSRTRRLVLGPLSASKQPLLIAPSHTVPMAKVCSRQNILDEVQSSEGNVKEGASGLNSS